MAARIAVQLVAGRKGEKRSVLPLRRSPSPSSSSSSPSSSSSRGNMDPDEDKRKELPASEKQREEYWQRGAADATYCDRDDLELADTLQSLLGEQTPVRDCADLYGLNSENGDDGSRGVDEPTEAPRLKRRRRLQYSSSDADIGISDELLASEPVKSKIAEESLRRKDGTIEGLERILGPSDNVNESLDPSLEEWLASCLNESEMDVSSAQTTNVSEIPSNHADASEQCNVPRQRKTLELPVKLSFTPSKQFRGSPSHKSTPQKTASPAAYRFGFIKPCGFLGETTLEDINGRVNGPLLWRQQAQTLREDPQQG